MMMKQYLTLFLISIFILLSGCNSKADQNTLIFATSAEYPPFEFYQNGQMKGFDIELAELIAKKMGKTAAFENMQFSTILPALNSGIVDLAIATMTVTEARQKNFDFSIPYYTARLAMVFPTTQPLTTLTQLKGKKIACQLGTTMEIWLKEHTHEVEIIPMDSNNQAIEALKSGHVDGVFMDSIQSVTFSEKNAGLSYHIMGESDDGYAIALPKNSPLKPKVDSALLELKASGELHRLQQKWLDKE